MPLVRSSDFAVVLYINNIYLLRVVILLTGNMCAAMSGKCKVKNNLFYFENTLVSSAQLFHS